MVKKVLKFSIKLILILMTPIVRLIAAFKWSRKILNAVYLKLSSYQRGVFYNAFAKMYRNSGIRGRSGHWRVAFNGKPILMPLTSGQFWQEWDTAVSITGHDLEVKETYSALIGSTEKPNLFIDIGANYGTHSLLFNMQNFMTMTF